MPAPAPGERLPASKPVASQTEPRPRLRLPNVPLVVKLSVAPEPAVWRRVNALVAFRVAVLGTAPVDGNRGKLPPWGSRNDGSHGNGADRLRPVGNIVAQEGERAAVEIQGLRGTDQPIPPGRSPWRRPACRNAAGV